MDKRRVLIVENDKAVRQTLTIYLEGAGYACLETGSGQEALSLLSTQWVDVIILDALLEEGTGIELCRAIRQLPSQALIPIIVMASEAMASKARTLATGIDDILLKPISPDTLISRVNSLTRLKRYRKLSTLQRQFDTLVQMAPFGWVLIDSAHRILQLNRRFKQMCPEADGTAGYAFLHAFAAESRPRIRGWLQAPKGQETRGLEASLLGQGGERLPVCLQVGEAIGPEDDTQQILIQDLSAQRKWETLQFRTHYLDPLTGLPNRRLLAKMVDEVALSQEPSLEACPGLVLIDLDHFHRFNVSMGHGFGDDLLKSLTNLLEDALDESSILARVGADEFVVFMSKPGPLSQLETLVDTVRATLAPPVQVRRTSVHVRATYGLAHGWDDGETLLRYVHSAASEAKKRLRGSSLTYNQLMGERAEGFSAIARDLRRALKAREFFLEYQPIVSLKTWEVLGFEALLRWRNRRGGLIPPSHFIPVAEETGFIVDLGNFAIDQACHDLAEWNSHPTAGPRLSVNVNVSPFQLREKSGLNFQKRVARLIDSSAIEPRDLKLEITESAVVRGSEGSSGFFRQMKRAGVRIQVDDFGTGYSCLSYLTRLPLDALKIDRSFVSRFNSKKADAEVVKAIVNLGAGLGLETVAEGVETLEQATFLQELGCSLAQGYLFAKPMAGPQVLPFLEARGGRLNPASIS